ncbi:Gfo/Idh/MocA family oxidoreductase [Candidatus Woesearchaeota archaeon]|nr:Gfo/Idh/MocA family oxidoreductase [Candidatus Woesearchaeota archaeon]
MIRTAVIGCGYWGPNLARHADQAENSQLKWCIDLDEARLKEMKAKYRNAQVSNDYREALKDKDVNAFVIATPASTHYKVAKEALENGKHVLVEKPMAYSSKECDELIKTAKKSGSTLMVGHTFEYNVAVEQLRKYMEENMLGEPYYAYSTRVNLGRIRWDVNAMWNLAPHDISILRFLLGKNPLKVRAIGQAYVQEGIEDVAFLTMEFPKEVMCQVHVSWLDPGKIRKMTLVGEKKMAVFDDLDNEAPLKIYDKGVTKVSGEKVYGQYQLKLRAGDILIPNLKRTEPLKNEYDHFVKCIETGSEPRSGGKSGLEVVKVLEAAQKSIKKDGSIEKLQWD